MKFTLIAATLAVASLGAAAPAFAGTDTSNALVTVTETSPGNFTFSETGFSGGASVTGTLSGTDNNANGQLSSFDGEVTAFAMSFSGNSQVAAFTVGLSGLFGFVYDLNGGPLGDSYNLATEGVYASATNGAVWKAGPGPFNFCTGSNACGQVSSPFSGGGGGVPEPASWAMMLVGFAGLGVALRSSRRAVFQSVA